MSLDRTIVEPEKGMVIGDVTPGQRAYILAGGVLASLREEELLGRIEEAEETSLIHSMAAQIYHEKDGIDGLTQLFNHTMFEQKLKEQIARTRRDGTTFGLVFYDVDNFKEFNDTYGHKEAGDPVLQAVANASVDCLRDVDVVGRYGGEEFVAIVYDLQPGDGTS